MANSILSSRQILDQSQENQSTGDEYCIYNQEKQNMRIISRSNHLHGATMRNIRDLEVVQILGTEQPIHEVPEDYTSKKDCRRASYLDEGGGDRAGAGGGDRAGAGGGVARMIYIHWKRANVKVVRRIKRNTFGSWIL
jgi:hypothetical protein